MSHFRSLTRLTLLFLTLMAVLAARQAPAVSAAPPTELFISEYIEGTSNNKAIEIYNGTGAAIDLGANVYKIEMYFNGSLSVGLTFNLTGIVAAGDVHVIAHGSANPAILAQADQVSATGAGWFNGDDAVVLRKGTTLIDVIGQIGFDPGTEWGAGLTSTADNTLARKAAMCTGDLNGSDAFDPSIEWDGFAVDTFSSLGSHTADCDGGDVAPTVTGTTPADNAANVAANTNITVTFSELVNVSGSISVVGTSSGAQNLTPTTTDNLTFTLDPADFTAGETVTVTVDDAQVADQDAADPPDNMAAEYTFDFTIESGAPVCDQAFTPIYDIQGNGSATPIPGTVTTEGVVVGDYEGASPALRGFYLQDVTGDGNASTSDGIFVFDGSNSDTVAVGDVVRVTGTAAEFQDQTQISISVSSIVDCGTGSVTPVDVTFPVPSATFLEQYEGMLVRLPQTLYVTEHFQLGRFGQVVMSSGGRLQQPTNVVLPGAPALALQAANNLNRIIIDDPLNNQNPDPIPFGRGGNPLTASNTLRGGDTATNIVGIMTYTWAGNSASGNAYRVRPVGALNGGVPDFQPTNPRPASAPTQTGGLRVGGMNVLNYFNTFDGLPDTVDNCTLGVGGAATDCRGADTQAEFDRQWPKTVAALVGSGADVIGLGEIENDGYGANSAIATLTDQLNAVTAPGTYAYIDVDATTGQVNALGTDAIKVGFIYQPGSVTPVGTTAALNTVAFVNGGDSAPRNRPALAQAFEEVGTGARFIVVANHLKSKGSACDAPDAGDGQGNCNVVRTNAVNQLIPWLAGDPTGTGDPDVLIVGDLNSYAKEDPIAALESAGYINLIAQFEGPNAYSYAFDGQWGYLDHALGNSAMEVQVTGVAEWHINADEPNVLDYNIDFKTANQQIILYAPDQFRMSDHDLALVDLSLTPPDTAAPETTITLFPTNPSNSANATFEFGANETATFECRLDGGAWLACASPQTYTGLSNGSHTFEVRATDAAGNTDPTPASYTWTIDTSVYDFSGFFPPVSNPPAINIVNSGSSVPLKFTLGGNYGLDIFASGYPVSRPISCTTGDPIGPDAPLTGALKYNARNGEYNFTWKTFKGWTGCREMVMLFDDGTEATALFQFKR
jgi:predicted extracellular nuclease